MIFTLFCLVKINQAYSLFFYNVNLAVVVSFLTIAPFPACSSNRSNEPSLLARYLKKKAFCFDWCIVLGLLSLFDCMFA